MKRRNAATAVAALSVLLAGPAEAAKVVYDYAQVESVETIVESVAAPPAGCETVPATPPGDLRSAEPGIDLVSAIRREAGRSPVRDDRRSCFTPAGDGRRTEIVGYRVRYRYGGDVFERTMTTHPGERLRVKVTLSPHR